MNDESPEQRSTDLRLADSWSEGTEGAAMGAIVVVPTMSDDLPAAANGVLGKGAVAFLEVVEETAVCLARRAEEVTAVTFEILGRMGDWKAALARAEEGLLALAAILVGKAAEGDAAFP